MGRIARGHGRAAILEARTCELAREWLAAWNARDPGAILSHYADDVVFQSPFAIRLSGDPQGIVRGKEALREYFAKGLAAYPGLHFELYEVFAGVDSFTVYYRSVNGLLAAEVMVLDKSGKIVRVYAHYKPS